MKSYLLDLRQKDEHTASKIQREHEADLVLVEQALEQVLCAWSEFSSQKTRPNNPLESARLFLVVRSFNSLRAALPTLEQGYYQQAATLIRMVMEDQLIAEDIEVHPPTLKALLRGKGLPKLGSMANRISPEAKVAWDSDYHTLSYYTTHTNRASLQGLNSVGPDGQLTLQPGGHYDNVQVMTVLYYLLRQLVFVMATIAKVSHSAGVEWDATTASKFFPVFERIEVRWREIDEWARKQIEESD